MMLHAFVDESKAGDYVIVAAVLTPGDLTTARRTVRGLLLGNQRRIHFYKEHRARKREILAAIAGLGVFARAYVQPPGRDARANCLAAMVEDLAALGVGRLVWERDDSVLAGDQRDLYAATRKARPGDPDWLEYHAMRAHEEILLAIPDAVAWCWTAGGPWRSAVSGYTTLV